MNRIFRTTTFLLLGCSALFGAVGASAQDAANPAAPADTTATEEARLLETAFLAVSEEGRFEAIWPSGCGERRLRIMPSPRYEGRPYAVDVNCERAENVGARVTVYFETNSGEPPVPADVTATISKLIAKLGVEIWQQRAIRRGDREGVAVFCREPAGARHIWMEGFIRYDRVILAMAWGVGDGLYVEPEVVDFFRSLRALP